MIRGCFSQYDVLSLTSADIPKRIKCIQGSPCASLLSSVLLISLCGAGRLLQNWSACGQHECQNTEWGVSRCAYNDIFFLLQRNKFGPAKQSVWCGQTASKFGLRSGNMNVRVRSGV